MYDLNIYDVVSSFHVINMHIFNIQQPQYKTLHIFYNLGCEDQ